MGLDLLLYDRTGKLVRTLMIPPTLNRTISLEPEVWRSYSVLRTIKDYYKSNTPLNTEEIDKFKSDLQQISIFLNSEYKKMAFQLISELTNYQPWKIRITGD